MFQHLDQTKHSSRVIEVGVCSNSLHVEQEGLFDDDVPVSVLVTLGGPVTGRHAGRGCVEGVGELVIRRAITAYPIWWIV